MEPIYDCIRNFKENFNYDLKLYVSNKHIVQAFLRPLNYKDLADDSLIDLLTLWREENYDAYPSQFKVTSERTRRWLAKFVLDSQGKLLFLLEDFDGNKIGHMGVANYNFKNRHIEMDNIVRGNKQLIQKGIITNALYDLISWTFLAFPIDTVYLRVFKDNERAIALYKRLKFVETKLIPLIKIDNGSEIKFVEFEGNEQPNRYFSFMVLNKIDHFNNYNVKYGE